jgi:hypothetical protein
MTDPHPEWDFRRLQKFSFEQIEGAFAKALQELTGQPYEVEIRSLNRHPKYEHSAALFDRVDMRLRVKSVDSEPLGAQKEA